MPSETGRTQQIWSRLTYDKYVRLYDLASAESKSVSEYLRDLVDAALERKGTEGGSTVSMLITEMECLGCLVQTLRTEHLEARKGTVGDVKAKSLALDAERVSSAELAGFKDRLMRRQAAERGVSGGN